MRTTQVGFCLVLLAGACEPMGSTGMPGMPTQRDSGVPTSDGPPTGGGSDAHPPPPPPGDAGGPIGGTIGPTGGSVDRLAFAVFGDVRPGNLDDDASYPLFQQTASELGARVGFLLAVLSDRPAAP